MTGIGKILIGFGLFIAAIGLVLWIFGDRLGWIGHLPGDIRVERRGFRLYIPLATMLLASILLSGLLWLFSRFFR